MTPMVPVDEYSRRILDSVHTLPACTVLLGEALGRVAAQDVHCHLDLPPFDTAAMDGFAVRSRDVAGASEHTPARLRVVGEVRMGRVSDRRLGKGQAMAVPTGSQVPPGADAVVPIEQCVVANSMLSVHEPIGQGKHVRLAGEDLTSGELIVATGNRLRAMDMAALASAGAGTAEVVAVPAVGIISTGDELVSPGEDLRLGQIFDSNSYLLRALTAELGARPVDCGLVRDDPQGLLAALQKASEQVDLLVCSGGVSAGLNDPVRRAVAEGLQAECVSVAMKPGRPQAFGDVAGTPFIALPGNPASVLVSFEVFVRPALHKMMGLAYQVEYTHAVVEEALRGAEERVCYVPMRLRPTAGGWIASPERAVSRSRRESLSAVRGLVRLLPGASLNPGDCAEILVLDTWP
ncbi:MAG: molybdopterin molybdotransferase MoeA [Actinobacteria bacterium]|nr:molybdopterin molybdotransferase MoeA [Actinomycetota bacterium]